MEFGIGIPTSGDSWKVAQRAEELGFTHTWFYDTQMLVADPFVAMGGAALKTSRIRLGTGVLVPTNRIPAVTAAGFATLNAMAPGRIDFGVGTGFSARRAMGLGAMKLADMEEYIRVVYALLNGETTEAEVDPGVRKKIRFLNPELGLINIKDPIKLHISALGPKGRQMTARHGAAWKTVMSGVDDGLAALRGMQKTWADSGRPAGDLYASAWVWGCLLRDGETLDSPRVRAEAGPRAAVLLHRAADVDMEGWLNTSPVPDSVKAVLQGYVEAARRFEPADARYLMNHTGHCVAIKPEEERFISAELIRQTTFTGTEQDIKQRIEAMRDGGLSQLVIPIVPGHEAAIEDWGRIAKAFH
ncbi:MAG TPA: LLM class flavin-dependent oxidoreductase [Rhodopila sp.]|jgi:5,10-methylenetetrahydromethanopterin reductase|nr:LLM class flavin-dependent oxidoreductase [Rhodopila sp.]